MDVMLPLKESIAVTTFIVFSSCEIFYIKSSGYSQSAFAVYHSVFNLNKIELGCIYYIYYIFQ